MILSGRGGVDKATADEKYELLRYYTLTDDRLFTKKDIEAFIRKEVIRLFGYQNFFIQMNLIVSLICKITIMT